HVASLVKHLRLLQARDLDLAADVLGPLPPLELDVLDSQFLDGVFLHPEARILDVALADDGPIPVTLVVLEEVDPAL
ncbi:MAG: hypothetical protein JSU63_09960, partial [Phycisphaerales bacterium]